MTELTILQEKKIPILNEIKLLQDQLKQILNPNNYLGSKELRQNYKKKERQEYEKKRQENRQKKELIIIEINKKRDELYKIGGEIQKIKKIEIEQFQKIKKQEEEEREKKINEEKMKRQEKTDKYYKTEYLFYKLFDAIEKRKLTNFDLYKDYNLLLPIYNDFKIYKPSWCSPACSQGMPGRYNLEKYVTPDKINEIKCFGIFNDKEMEEFIDIFMYKPKVNWKSTNNYK